MRREHEALYGKIREFPLDEPGSVVSFTRRLADENGWTLEKARRVVDEYKKFVFLAMAAGHPVSPSDAVDQAWHLHMTYTQSYWERFCRETLGKTFHHEPTRGGCEEQKKFAAWYAKTLGSYQTFFGKKPPADLWPESGARPGPKDRYERVNRTGNFVVSRRTLSFAGVAVITLSAAFLLTRYGNAISDAFRKAMDLRGPDFLGYYGMTFAAVLVAGLLFRRNQRKPDDEPSDAELALDPYEIAYLAGGEKQAANAAIAALVNRGVLAVNPSAHKVMREAALPADALSLEHAIYQVASVSPGSRVSSLHAATAATLRRIREKLDDLGLFASPSRAAVARVVPIAGLAAMTALGLAKVSVGMDRGRPVAFLVILILLFLGIGLAVFLRGLGRSRRGDRVLERLKRNHGTLLLKAARAEAGLTALEVPMAAALFGVAALTGGSFSALKQTLKPPPATGLAESGGSGCGSGCGMSSGGGCGGGGCAGGGCGGGGCGGCGGGG